MTVDFHAPSLGAVLSLAVLATALGAGPAAAQGDRATILAGRALTLSHACGGCHGGGDDPTAEGYLAGMRDTLQQFRIGPFITRPRNLTPDNTTGLGRFSERQIFNALRFGLRPGETPDVEITGTTPGQGNFPEHPKFLAPPMPWPAWRHMTDEELRAVAAYLKRGVKPVRNQVQDSDGPPDFWASEYTVEKIGAWPAVAFPAASEREPEAPGDRAKVLLGRKLVLAHDCGGCHGGGPNPAAEGYLAGMRDTLGQFRVGPFITRPRNLTPDNTTGLGRFSERQIFNAIRFGLRPGETPDVEITGSTPGQGNFPEHPKFLAPPMPWPAWRHMTDEEIWAVAAYLKRGVKPVRNQVQDSDGPPDFWASEYTVPKIGAWPALAYPAASEK